MQRQPYQRLFETSPKRPLTQAAVDQVMNSLWKEYERRLSARAAEDEVYGITKNESAKNFIRRELYDLGTALLKNPPSWRFDDLVDRVRLKTMTRPDQLEKVFHTLFLILYESDDRISRKERWLMAKELEYAYRHEVPSQYLCGFLYQSGGRRGLIEKIEKNYVEPAFRNSVQMA